MLYIIDSSTDPYWNLAAEEYLLYNFSDPVFRLWRNAPSIIVGRNQNALAEINADYVRSRSIAVVRRLSGGGAVFHDLGNVNYTFIEKKIEGEQTSDMFRRCTAPIISALQGLDVAASLEGRNDLLIEGRKFSGNAIAVHRDRVLQHGTLLFSASIAELGDALLSRPEKYSDKGVKSNVTRVTNISSHLKSPMNVEQFMDYLRVAIAGGEIYQYSAEDLKAISALSDSKYRTDSWNYGSGPRYSFSKVKKLPCGLVELYMDVNKGVIEHLDIRGDYFFIRPTEEFCAALVGIEHNYEKIAGAISTISPGDYFGPVSVEELTDMFF